MSQRLVSELRLLRCTERITERVRRKGGAYRTSAVLGGADCSHIQREPEHAVEVRVSAISDQGVQDE